MKYYAVVEEYQATIRRTIYLCGKDEEDALANYRVGRVWDYAGDETEIDCDSWFLDESTLIQVDEDDREEY